MLKWEAKLKHRNVQSMQMEGTTLTFDNLKLDIAELRKDMDKGIKLLAMGNCIVLDKRRVQLKGFFDSKYHLFKPSNPPTTWFLGDSINQKIMDFNKVHEAAQKIQFKLRANFVHRNKFRPYSASPSQGHRKPYHNNNTAFNFSNEHRNFTPNYNQNTNYSKPRGGHGSGRFQFPRRSRNNYRGHSTRA